MIGEMKGQGLDVPQVPAILDINPPILRHELDYISVPLGPAKGWGFTSVLD